MEINDDNDHYIRVHNNIRYDYLLNTTNKSKPQIFKELKENVFNSKTFFLNNTNTKTKKNYPNKYLSIVVLTQKNLCNIIPNKNNNISITK